MPSDLEHWYINAKVYDDRVEEIHLISDPARNIRRKQYTKVWHIERYLGRGSFGDVRLERNRNEDKVRAVKRVATSSSTFSQKECEQELKALLEFSKPKSKDAAIFVEFFGWFNSGLNIYLAMEYVELGDLERNVQLYSGKLPEVEAQNIAEQILSGLEIMHTASFAHRDLKPQNVLVVVGPPQWWVKLADFGLSKRLTDSTAYRTLAGTLSYMAPEILNYLEPDTSGKYTNAVDLWAVGCIIYRLITGNVPFPQGNSLIQYCRDELPFPGALLIKCGITDSGFNFLRQLLAKDHKERPSAAKALQHGWIMSSTDATIIPASASHTSLRRAELSRSSYSAIGYNTASHAGLKSYGPFLSSKSPTSSSPRTIPPTASSSTSNKMEAPYESETIIRASQNSEKESAVADDVPVELASNSHKSHFTGGTTDPAKPIGSEGFERGRDLFIDRKYSEAEQVFQQISRRREKVLGKEAEETLESKYWLARTLFAQEQDQKAEELFREVVQGKEKVLGKETEETLECKHWLARTLFVQEQDQKAEELFREVVRGREKVLGKEAEETLESKYWLAATFYAQKQYQKAEELFRKVVQRQVEVLGKEAEETLESKYWLARTLLVQVQYQKAKEILDSKHWLARMLYVQNQNQKAKELLREVVQGQEKVLGKEAEETLKSKYWLARTLYVQKQYQKAKELYREVVRGREKVLGKEAEKTFESKYWLAATFYAQKQYQKAEELLREVVGAQEQVLGTEHPGTTQSRRQLNRILNRLEPRNGAS